MSTLTTTRLGRAVALMAVAGSMAAMPAGASAAREPAARAGAQPVALSASSPAAKPVAALRVTKTKERVRTKWGFNAQLWSYTMADPWALNRVRYYNKCNPKRGVRFFKFKTSWIYTTYECWAILA